MKQKEIRQGAETRFQDKTGLPRKKRRLKYIAVLPSFITLMNGACGFISIVLASRSPVVSWNLSFIRRGNVNSFALAGYMIFFAMLADMLDGRVARLTRTTSSFGGQLDSLSDAISFGVAPAFLSFKLIEYHLNHLRLENLRLPMLLERGIFFSAILYAMCAVVRLARFNVENDEDESAHMNFSGLPSPGAAGVLASLVVFHQMKMPAEASDSFRIFEVATVSVLPVITLLSGILMVSRIRYPHLMNQLLRSKRNLPTLLLIFASGLFIIWDIQLAALIGFCGFAVTGVIRWIVVAIRKTPPRRQDNAVPPESKQPE